MLAQRRRQWANIKTAMEQRVVLAGLQPLRVSPTGSMYLSLQQLLPHYWCWSDMAVYNIAVYANSNVGSISLMFAQYLTNVVIQGS